MDVFYVVQIIIGLFTLLLATFFAWYEGSAIIENSLEWKYSTPFTQLLQGEVTSGRAISQLDYFVYAVKFQPLFPLIMLVSILYLLSVITHFFMKTQSKWAITFCVATGLVMIGGSCFILSSAPTINQLFFWLLFCSGILFLAAALLRQFKHRQVNSN